MLEQDDITVAVGENDLGTISWTPKKYTEMLWMIGQNDRRSSEFRLSDTIRQYGLWELVPQTLTYTIGESTESKDWYYAQTKDGNWTVKFNVDKRPSGRVYLTASIAGCASEKATITVKLNGTVRDTWKPGYKDASVYRSAVNSGRHYVFTTDFLSAALKEGTNLLTFQISGTGGKNGILYDCIKLEAGEPVTDGIIAPHYSPFTLHCSPAKRLVNGRLVIEKAGHSYTPAGVRIE